MAKKKSSTTSTSSSPAGSKRKKTSTKRSKKKAGKATEVAAAAGAEASPADVTDAPAKKKTSKKKSSKSKASAPAATQEAAAKVASVDPHLAAVIESIGEQMSAAMATLEELSTAKDERDQAAVTLKPIDRATTSFQRLVAEVIDDQLAEMLPPLITLRSEMSQYAATSEGDENADLYQRSVETLDHVLELAGVQRYEARVGETCDPLIHLAVGETSRDDLSDRAVAEALGPGFRSARGKVIVPAKVRVNRR